MGAKGIRSISEIAQSGHPGQVAGSARKKTKKKENLARLHAEAKAAGVTVSTIRMRRQQEVNKCEGLMLKSPLLNNGFVPRHHPRNW